MTLVAMATMVEALLPVMMGSLVGAPLSVLAAEGHVMALIGGVTRLAWRFSGWVSFCHPVSVSTYHPDRDPGHCCLIRGHYRHVLTGDHRPSLEWNHPYCRLIRAHCHHQI